MIQISQAQNPKVIITINFGKVELRKRDVRTRILRFKKLEIAVATLNNQHARCTDIGSHLVRQLRRQFHLSHQRLVLTFKAHASAPNISPWPRNNVYSSLNHVDNRIRRRARPEFYAAWDAEALEPLADDCLISTD